MEIPSKSTKPLETTEGSSVRPGKRKLISASELEPILKKPKFSSVSLPTNHLSSYNSPKSSYSALPNIRRATSKQRTSKSAPTTENPGESKHAKKSNIFEYGNYKGYYGYRLDENGEDPRMQLLDASWFENKSVLDIGCNAGVVTLRIAQQFGSSHITGIDIDESLINKAKKNRGTANFVARHASTDTKPTKFHGGGHFTAITPASPSSSSTERMMDKIDFQVGNYIETVTIEAKYDTIICLSVVKWIHLNWGDDGLKKLFRKVNKELRPGGIFVVEIQAQSSYQKAKSLTKTIRKHWKENQIKPKDIADLITADFGFKLISTVEPKDRSVSKGFARPVHVFEKVSDISNLNTGKEVQE